jgi:ABC-type lipoprotein export system ATPase subunit
LSNWTKYDYLCINCSTLLEITTTHQDIEDPICVCAEPDITRVNKEDVTKLTDAHLDFVFPLDYN